jgi:hypothetical protein
LKEVSLGLRQLPYVAEEWEEDYRKCREILAELRALPQAERAERFHRWVQRAREGFADEPHKMKDFEPLLRAFAEAADIDIHQIYQQ